jgi:AraC-like DNA-binding protein
MAMSTSSGFSSAQSHLSSDWRQIPGPAVANARGGVEPATARVTAIDPCLTHVGLVEGIPVVLRELGSRPDEVIASAGIDPRVFDDAENVLSLAALDRLLSVCVRRTGCTHFGLLVGGKASASSFGLIGLLMQHSPTVRAALTYFVEHSSLYDRAAAPNLDVRDGVAVLSYALHSAGIASADQVVEVEIAAAYRIMKIVCGPSWLPTEVLLPRASLRDPTPFHHSFQAPVRLGREEAAIVFEARWLDHPIARADLALHNIAERSLKELVQADHESFGSQLRRTLRTMLLRKGFSAARIASLYAMHRRTMSRQLQAEGLSFQQLVNEVRYDAARQMIGGARMPLAEVAAALGYSEPSALTRAFRRWSGQGPAAWRLANGNKP